MKERRIDQRSPGLSLVLLVVVAGKVTHAGVTLGENRFHLAVQAATQNIGNGADGFSID